MKTKFTAIIAGLVLTIGTVSFTYAANKADDGTSTNLTEIGSINKIEASGNVDVYIVNGDKDEVKVYNDYYGQNAVVKNENGVLHITSYAKEKLMVLVSVTDLQAITANDNAFIKTYGDGLYAKLLNININDDAIATLKLNAQAANITVNDEGRADLLGNVDSYNLNYSAKATVNKSDLRFDTSTETQITQPVQTRTHAMGFGTKRIF